MAADHGGLNGFPEFGQTEDLLANHDRLLRDNSWRVGAGASYALRQSLSYPALCLRWSVAAILTAALASPSESPGPSAETNCCSRTSPWRHVR